MATATTTAATVVKEARYVLTNIASNNNKFWSIRLFGDGTCETHWGRVGEDGQRKQAAGMSEYGFDAKCREKAAKGYKPQKTLGNTAGGASLGSEKLAEVARTQIETNSPETMALVAYLARVNVHRILQATTLQFDESKGTFSTPLGIVTADAIAEARGLLTDIAAFVQGQDYSNSGFVGKLNDYLMLVPQNIGRAKPDPKTLFPDLEAVQKQSSILDSLDASLQTVLSSSQDKTEEAPAPKLFEARLHLVEDEAEIARIRKKYRATQQAMHACHYLEVKRVFRIEIGSMRRAFEERGRQIGNIQELWHGTKASNLLSILKSGFVIPPGNAAHCTGRMFGNGCYFSDQSTKSLNYAYGYWSGTREETCYMFLANVAMGKAYTPKSYSERLPMAGYDSTFARAGKSGVANNEMIVYDTCQIDPVFLVEFAPKDGK